MKEQQFLYLKLIETLYQTFRDKFISFEAEAQQKIILSVSMQIYKVSANTYSQNCKT